MLDKVIMAEIDALPGNRGGRRPVDLDDEQTDALIYARFRNKSWSQIGWFFFRKWGLAISVSTLRARHREACDGG